MEAMQEQLQALAEQVRQLQAENNRLREQSASTNDSHSGGFAPSTSGRPPSVLSEPVSERYVFVPRERNCPRFSGKVSCDLMSVEDWIEEARGCLSVRRMPQLSKLCFCLTI